ncbi:MAG: rhodanese-related sulfurtransferase [Nitriliruptoraceae bacterium]
MHPLRTSLFFAATTPLDDLEPILAVLHRFIQRGWAEGAVLDVADYRHVPDGPGVVLIGHDVDYGVEPGGLRLIRKRSAGDDIGTQLTDLLRMAAVFVEAFRYDGTVALDIDLASVIVEVRDRAVTASSDAADVAAALLPAATAAYGQDVELEPVTTDDPRPAVSVRVTGNVSSAAAFLAQLGGSRAPSQSAFDITVERFAELRQHDNVVVVDVREATEYETVNLGGTLLPLAGLEQSLTQLDRSKTVVVHCRAGLRGAKAVQILRDAGFDDAWNVNGGLVAWADRIDAATVRY